MLVWLLLLVFSQARSWGWRRIELNHNNLYTRASFTPCLAVHCSVNFVHLLQSGRFLYTALHITDESNFYSKLIFFGKISRSLQ